MIIEHDRTQFQKKTAKKKLKKMWGIISIFPILPKHSSDFLRKSLPKETHPPTPKTRTCMAANKL